MKYLFALFLAAAGSQAVAEPCAPHNVVMQMLGERYGESRQAVAMDTEGRMLEVYASEAGSYTIVLTAPGGLTCLASAGQAFQFIAEPLPPMGQEG